MTKLKSIKTEKEYDAYLKWANQMFDTNVKRNTPEGEELEVALNLIKQYEDKEYPIPSADSFPTPPQKTNKPA